MWLKSPAGTFRNRSLRLIEHWEGGGTKTRSLGKECLALCLSSRHTEELPSEQVGEHNKGFVRAGRRENVCMERRNERRQREKREGGETLIQVIACLFAPVKAIKKNGSGRDSHETFKSTFASNKHNRVPLRSWQRILDGNITSCITIHCRIL